MKNRLLFNLILVLFLVNPSGGVLAERTPAVTSAIAQPVLKWSGKGCYSSWCETGWYSSPAVADLNGDGQNEIIASAYSIVVLNGSDGALQFRLYSGHDRSYTGSSSVGRTWPGIVVADIDGNGGLEIVTAHSGGWVSVYDQNGYFKPGWPKQPTPGNELRSLGAFDMEQDGMIEVLVASTKSKGQWHVFEPDGSLRPGSWPQHNENSSSNGYSWGCYNQNLAAGDVDGDGRAEVIGPNDTHYIDAFEDDGSQVLASPIYGTREGGGQKFWSLVGVHVDHAVDLRGYANCGTEHRPNFANSTPIVVDVNNDGVNEVVVIGNVYNCGTDPYTDLYEIPYILNGDRTRWKGGGYDWTVLPTPEPGSAPISEDYDVIESNAPNPVAADLDGDGNKEILYPSYDGRLHAYWLDRTEHGSWPYSVNKPAEGFRRFATEPVVADLDRDGKAEVIFGSWVQKGTGKTGKLHILDSNGVPIWEVDLPAAVGGSDWNGVLAAPTLANIDSDPDLEVVLNTTHSGVVAYDLPGTASAKIIWETGRGNFQRSGSEVRGSLARSILAVNNPTPAPGEEVKFTFTLRGSGPALQGVTLTNTLPPELIYTGGLLASSGVVSIVGSTISWSGDVTPSVAVSIAFRARVEVVSETPVVIRNVATVNDGESELQLSSSVIINGYTISMPLARRN